MSQSKRACVVFLNTEWPDNKKLIKPSTASHPLDTEFESLFVCLVSFFLSVHLFTVRPSVRPSLRPSVCPSVIFM